MATTAVAENAIIVDSLTVVVLPPLSSFNMNPLLAPRIRHELNSRLVSPGSQLAPKLANDCTSLWADTNTYPGWADRYEARSCRWEIGGSEKTRRTLRIDRRC